MKKIRTSLLMLAAPLSFYQTAFAQSTTQTYRDWSVVCNNVKTCMAFSVSSQSEGGLRSRPQGLSEDVPEGWMTIERAAGPNAVARIVLSRPDMASTELPPGAELHILRADGRAVSRGIFAATIGSSGAIEVHPSLNGQFISAARSASHAMLVVGSAKRRVFFVSLSGLVASGRSIDAHQGRTNSIGALIDVGRLSNARVPAPPRLPVVSAISFTKRTNAIAPPVIVRRRLDDCEDAERFDPGGRDIEAFDLGAGRTLWSVPCGAGAYNMWSRFYIQSGRNVIDAVRFNDVPEKNEEEQQGLVNAAVDPRAGTVTAFSKARGLGDCGDAVTFTWTGRAFEVTQASSMGPCGGIMPEFWPSIFEARVVQSGMAGR